MEFFLNGKAFSSAKKAGIDYKKDEQLFARSVFETLRTYNGKIFALQEHLDRLWQSAQLLDISLPASKKIITEALQECAKCNNIAKSELRLKVLLKKEYFWIRSGKIIPLPASTYKKGVEVCDATFDRPFARAKYSSPAYEKFRALQEGHEFFETLLFDTDGFLREGNISNVFALFGKTIVTPEEKILLGVTREKTLSLMKSEKIPFELRDIHREELHEADEIFLTNTTKEIIPVSQWGTWRAQSLNTAKKLRELFHKHYVL
ncbi:aminotransferase class IV [Candidatus Gracilibacteria bacterium]|nr:aminotransferase class IV [Candidatus Gracilibacteria bacterium]MCF7819344.1 aminotransferase class IV [Candidatus Gracilibacteria bacterium]